MYALYSSLLSTYGPFAAENLLAYNLHTSFSLHYMAIEHN